MLTDLGFTDTLERFATLNHDSGVIAMLANPFAAVPSLHTCYALVIGLTCYFLFRWLPARIAALFYPVLIVFSIVATGNHFWTDAVLGAVVASIAFGAAWLIERRWPTLPESARRRLHILPEDEPATEPAAA
jgi:membrane-associated phospholipid phosphatase